jgi:hypothetical protein
VNEQGLLDQARDTVWPKFFDLAHEKMVCKYDLEKPSQSGTPLGSHPMKVKYMTIGAV